MTALYGGHDSGPSPVRISISMSRASSSISATSNQSISSEAVDELTKLRLLWWEEGNIHLQARWEQIKLPYILVKNVSLEEYELRIDKFNVHGCWNWTANKVIIYEFPSKPHETFIGEISRIIVVQTDPVSGTNAHIGSLGAVRTRANNTGYEGDATFRPSKPQVPSGTGCDGEREPWPNLVVEVAYSQSAVDVLTKVKDYWLKNHSRVHDVVVIKIDQVPEGETPRRMQAWHFCVSDRIRRNTPIDAHTHFEFGTHDQAGQQLNILPGTCIINIRKNCLYHDVINRVGIPPNNVLLDPIQLDFLTIRDNFLRMFTFR